MEEGEDGDGEVVGVGGKREDVGRIVLGLGVMAACWCWLLLDGVVELSSVMVTVVWVMIRGVTDESVVGVDGAV